jgi:hypothetical protein
MLVDDREAGAREIEKGEASYMHKCVINDCAIIHEDFAYLHGKGELSLLLVVETNFKATTSKCRKSVVMWAIKLLAIMHR